MADKDWHSLLDYAQHLFQASFIPFRFARLLCHLIAMRQAPALSKTLMAKVLAVGQNKSLEATCQQIQDFSMELPSLLPQWK